MEAGTSSTLVVAQEGFERYQAAIAFDIQGDRICSYREYLAVIYTLPS